MNRETFMRELERLLANIPENERKEALAYYEDYFNDAGPENEQQVLAELGYPYKVAENIKEGLRGNMGYQNTGAGYQNAGYQHIGNLPAHKLTWLGVLWVLKYPGCNGFALVAFAGRKSSVKQSRHRVDNYTGGYLSARHHVVADRYFLVDYLVDNTLIHTLVMTA